MEITVAVFLQILRDKISLKDIDEVFLLVAVDPVTKVSTKFVQLFYFEYLCKFLLRLRDQRIRRSRDYNVVDIKIEEDILIFIYKAINIRDKCFETIFFEYGNDGVISLFRGAIQAI